MRRELGLFDSTMIVAGSMIGSGIFLISSDIARTVGLPGYILLILLITGIITLIAALSYGELAAMMPKVGGQYVYLREAYNPLIGLCHLFFNLFYVVTIFGLFILRRTQPDAERPYKAFGYPLIPAL